MKKTLVVLAGLALSSVAFAERETPRVPGKPLGGTPFAVANAAYNGVLEGIPGFGAFCSGVISRGITAHEVVEQAQAQGLTKGDVDAAYVKSVRTHIEALCRD